jgi:F-box domain
MSAAKDDMDWQSTLPASTLVATPGHLTTLPLDVLLELVKYLDVWDMFALRLVSEMSSFPLHCPLTPVSVNRLAKLFMSCARRLQCVITEPAPTLLC